MTTTIAALTVPNPLTLAWRQAVRAALAYAPAVRPVRRTTAGFVVEHEYDVTSEHEPGASYRVVTGADERGFYASCSCPQFKHRSGRGIPCKHLAAALLGEEVLSPDDVPAPAPSLLDLFAREDA